MREMLAPVACRAALAAAVIAAAVGAAPGSRGAEPGWTLSWSDEFAGSALDATKWDAISWLTPFNNERQAYDPARATVADGNLVLTADNTPLGAKAYTSGKVESKYTQRFGRWEVRAKLPGTRGAWPAIWLLPDTSTFHWPTQGEIDILENRGSEPNLTSSAFHYGPSSAGHQYKWSQQRTSVDGQLENYHNDFHVYAVEWDASKLVFFVDDVNYFTVYDADVGGFLASQSAPMETVLNVAVGGDFLGNAQPNSSSVWPQQMLVDYVRIYERDPDAPPRVLRNAGFEANEGALAGWSTFGNVLAANPNVQVHDEALLAGEHALKLFGQFNGQANHSGVQQGISVQAGDRVEAAASALVRSQDSIRGTANQSLLKLEFYSAFGGKYGSSEMISEQALTVADGATAENEWIEHTMSAVAPAGAVEARVVLLFSQPGNAGGAVHFDEVRFRNLDLATPADVDGDGAAAGEDFLGWQRGFGHAAATAASAGDFNFDRLVDAFDLSLWEQQFGAAAPAGVLAPEPTGVALAAAALWGVSRFRFFANGWGEWK